MLAVAGLERTPNRVGGPEPGRGVRVELTASEIRRQQFEQVRRGFDPQEVGVFLERVAEMIASRDREIASARAEVQKLERALDEARSAEEAVRLTMVAATKAKDEILAGANEDAGELLQTAQERAEEALTAARREALTLIEESRQDAEKLMASAKAEHEELLGSLDVLRTVVKKTGSLLKGMAAGALEELAHAEALVDTVGAATRWGTRLRHGAGACSGDPGRRPGGGSRRPSARTAQGRRRVNQGSARIPDLGG